MIFYSGAKIVRLCELCKDVGCICVAGYTIFHASWMSDWSGSGLEPFSEIAMA